MEVAAVKACVRDRRAVRLLAAALLCAGLAGCGDDATPGGEGAETGTGRDGAPAGGDSAAEPDGARDGSAENDGGADAACAAGATGDVDRDALALELPRAVRPGAPFVIAIGVGGRWSGDAIVCGDGAAIARARVYRGRGSASLSFARPGTLQLTVLAGTRARTVELLVADRPVRELTGVLGGDGLVWSAASDVQLSGDVRVPAGARLVVGAGTRVLLAANAALEVEGELAVEGRDGDPVLFTRAGDWPWGGIRVLQGGSARIEQAWLTGGGGDPARAFGHSSSQPVLWADGAELSVTGGGIVDNPGKALGAQDARVSVHDALISRCDSGGELEASVLAFTNNHVLEIPDGDGEADDDDNDGLYLYQSKLGPDGAPVTSIVSDSVFALGEDDAIDHNDAALQIERVWIEGFRHEGIAASGGQRVEIADSVVRDCAQGIEAGYGSPEVIVERCLLTGNGVGLRFGDEYEWETSGSLTVRGAIAYDNREDNVLNLVEKLGGPLPGALDVRCSLVDDEEYDGKDGNLAGPPSGELARGCADGPSLVAAECSDDVPGPTSCF